MGKGEGLGQKTLSLPHSMRMGCGGMCPDRWDAPYPMRQRLVRWDVAWAWPTTTTCREQETRHNHTQAALRLPRQDLEGPNNRISTNGETNGLPKSIGRLRQMPRDR